MPGTYRPGADVPEPFITGPYEVGLTLHPHLEGNRSHRPWVCGMPGTLGPGPVSNTSLDLPHTSTHFN